MTLTTATFSDLHHRITQSAVDANLATAELNRRTLDKLITLVEKRAELYDMQNTDRQIKACGAERWNNTHVRLSAVHEHPNTRLQGPELRQKIWEALPDSVFKRFQQLFSQTNDFVVPKFEIDAAGQVSFPKTDFAKLSLQGCLISADRIPEKLAEGLGLADFSGDYRQPLQRLAKKASFEALQTLKSIFEAAEPIEEGNFRILKVAPAAPEAAKRYRGAEIAPELHGTILYSREDATASGRLIVGHFQSAYAAQRKTFHEAAQYLSEIRKLGEIKEDVERFNGRLDRYWRAGASDEVKAQLREEAQLLSGRCVTALERCENRYKVRARDLIADVEQLTDSSGRTNIRGSMMKMAAAIRSLQERFAETQHKNAFNQDDQMALYDAVSRQERVIQNVCAAIREAAPLLEGHRLFSGVRLTRKEVEAEAKDLLRRSGLESAELDRVTLRPAHTFAARMAEKLGEFKEALAARDSEGAAGALIQMNVIAKHHAVQVGFDRIRHLLMSGDTVPFSAIRQVAGQLDQIVHTYQVLKDQRVESYTAGFGELSGAVRGLQGAIPKREPASAARREAVADGLRRYMKEVDLEEKVRALA